MTDLFDKSFFIAIDGSLGHKNCRYKTASFHPHVIKKQNGAFLAIFANSRSFVQKTGPYQDLQRHQSRAEEEKMAKEAEFDTFERGY